MNKKIPYEQMDRTGRILVELDNIVNENKLPESLSRKVENLIKDINHEGSTVNLFDFRKSDSEGRFGDDLVHIIMVADQRQQNKRR